MYKVEKFKGNPEELEDFLNRKCVVEHKTPFQIFSYEEGIYCIIFHDSDETKKKQILLEYANSNLCKECLTCSSFGYFCRGEKVACGEWELDENAYKRIDRVI